MKDEKNPHISPHIMTNQGPSSYPVSGGEFTAPSSFGSHEKNMADLRRQNDRSIVNIFRKNKVLEVLREGDVEKANKEISFEIRAIEVMREKEIEGLQSIYQKKLETLDVEMQYRFGIWYKEKETMFIEALDLEEARFVEAVERYQATIDQTSHPTIRAYKEKRLKEMLDNYYHSTTALTISFRQAIEKGSESFF